VRVIPSFEVEAASREVRIDGKPVAVGSRAFDVLVHPQANSDRVVTKHELLEAVWGGLSVEESNLTVQISALRKLLGPNAIATVPGVGYKLTTATAPSVDSGPDVPDIPSLAVLPFANLTGHQDRDYLVDGIVAEITASLSRISEVFVISSTSSFTYKGRAVDLSQVGRELGVRYILEGSIQQAGARLRIFTQLVVAESGHMIWQNRFDGDADEIFYLQDRIAEEVAGALEPKLQSAEAARSRSKPTGSLSAYDLCLRGSQMILRIDARDTLEEGLALLYKALELDPGYVRSQALICYAHTCAFATRWWSFEEAQAALPLARRILDRGTGEDAVALAYTGHYLAYIGHAYAEGLAALRQAHECNPNSATISSLLGWVMVYEEDNAAALAAFERAQRISPVHPHISVIRSGIANARLQMGDREGAVEYFERAQAEYSEFGSNQIGLIGAYWALGREEDARTVAAKLRQKVPGMTVSGFLESIPQQNLTYRDLMREALRGVGFPE